MGILRRLHDLGFEVAIGCGRLGKKSPFVFQQTISFWISLSLFLSLSLSRSHLYTLVPTPYSQFPLTLRDVSFSSVETPQ